MADTPRAPRDNVTLTYPGPDGRLRVCSQHGDWSLEYVFEPQDGYPVLAELTVSSGYVDYDESKPKPAPPGGLTARQLRTIPLGAALESARSALAKALADGGWGYATSTGREKRSLGYRADVVSAPRQPGRRGRDDSYYAKFAALYAAALERGSVRPIADVADELSRDNGTYSAGYVRDVIHQARVRGLLTQPPRRGLPGGRLTEKGQAALHGKDES